MTLRYHKKNMPCSFLGIIGHDRKSIKFQISSSICKYQGKIIFQIRFHISRYDAVGFYRDRNLIIAWLNLDQCNYFLIICGFALQNLGWIRWSSWFNVILPAMASLPSLKYLGWISSFFLRNLKKAGKRLANALRKADLKWWTLKVGKRKGDMMTISPFLWVV